MRSMGEGLAGRSAIPSPFQRIYLAPNDSTRLHGLLSPKRWTSADVAELDEATARSALRMAWANVAPKSLAKQG